MYLTVDSLVDINNIITGSNNITLTKVTVKSYVYDKMYVDKDLIEDKLHELIDQFSDRKISHRDFYFTLLDKIHPFYDENGRTCKILFVSSYNFSKTSTTQSKELMSIA